MPPRLSNDTTPPPGWPSEVAFLTRPRLAVGFPPELVPLLYGTPSPPKPPKAAKSAKPAKGSKSKPTPVPTVPPKPPITPPPIGRKYNPPPTPHPSTVLIKTVSQPGHPAHGQRCLVAKRRIPPGELLVPYLGVVHAAFTDREGRKVAPPAAGAVAAAGAADGTGMVSKSPGGTGMVSKSPDEVKSGSPISTPTAGPDSDPGSTSIPSTAPAPYTDPHESSDYDLSLLRLSASDIRNPYTSLGLHVSIGVDAAQAGNAARFVNDYRGVAAAPNAEFRLGCAEGGELRMEVWAIREIAKGEEVVVSYGKGWWAARVG